MAELPRMRLAQIPLLFLAASLAAGILLGHYAPSSRLILIATAVIAASLILISIWPVRRKQFHIAAVLILIAFLATGVVLSFVANQPADPNRIKRMFDGSTLALNEPVELTAVVEGPVQSAPDGLYLTVRAESLRVRGSERAAAGEVLLLAHVASPEARNEYQRLELRHGA